MGTNYYWSSESTCPTCGHERGEKLHIGKSSGGWCFSLRIHPELGINTLEDWQAKWASGSIVDEYGDSVTAASMTSIIADRRREPPDLTKAPFGYSSWDKMLADNDAEWGPNNLLRHRYPGRYGRCLGHGEGTWDYFVDEFS